MLIFFFLAMKVDFQLFEKLFADAQDKEAYKALNRDFGCSRRRLFGADPAISTFNHPEKFGIKEKNVHPTGKCYKY